MMIHADSRLYYSTSTLPAGSSTSTMPADVAKQERSRGVITRDDSGILLTLFLRCMMIHMYRKIRERVNFANSAKQIFNVSRMQELLNVANFEFFFIFWGIFLLRTRSVTAVTDAVLHTVPHTNSAQ